MRFLAMALFAIMLQACRGPTPLPTSTPIPQTATSPPPSETPIPPTPTPNPHAVEVLNSLAEAGNARDMEVVLDHFSEEAILIDVNGRQYGPAEYEQIEDFFQIQFDIWSATYDFRDFHVNGNQVTWLFITEISPDSTYLHHCQGEATMIGDKISFLRFYDCVQQ